MRSNWHADCRGPSVPTCHPRVDYLADEEISSHVRQFIAKYIPSVARLEILLLLKTQPSAAWTPEAMAKELRIDSRAAGEQLEALHHHGLVAAQPTGYHYMPQTPELDAAVTALMKAYLLRRVTVISLIFSKTDDVLRSFSDSFKLRRDNDASP